LGLAKSCFFRRTKHRIMVLFPNAKINLGLNILRKRADGYHELETVFYPIGLKDGLEFIENNKGVLRFSSSGIPLSIPDEDNIVFKAYRLLAADFTLPTLDIHLHKVIPSGAGFGGGSSDAAFFLKALNDYFHLGLSLEVLKSYALALGADCPFFLENRPVFAAGIGEELSPIELSLKGYHLIVVKPPVEVNTKSAYAEIQPTIPNYSLVDALRNNPESWSGIVVNAFEQTVFARYPEIQKVKQQLLELGAVYAAMSGSGSAVYGIFKQDLDLKTMHTTPDYFSWKELL
jgi:4-diphosphocytidyl-2-C-methyl-D-erythritol kinase